MLRFLCLLALLLGLRALSPAARAQTKAPAKAAKPAKPAPPRPAATPTGTFRYRGYAIYDQSAGPEPIVAEGVGGTLTLRPDGTYEKRLRVTSDQGPVTFEQTGRYVVEGPRITFDYRDRQNQPKADIGTFRYDAKLRALELTIVGFPAGNRGVYQLVAAP